MVTSPIIHIELHNLKWCSLNWVMGLDNWIMEPHNFGVLSPVPLQTIQHNRNKLYSAKTSPHDFYSLPLFSNCTCISIILRPLPQSFNTLRPRQNDHHFADDMFKYVFVFFKSPRLYVWYPRKLPLFAISRLWRDARFRNCRTNFALECTWGIF